MLQQRRLTEAQLNYFKVKLEGGGGGQRRTTSRERGEKGLLTRDFSSPLIAHLLSDTTFKLALRSYLIIFAFFFRTVLGTGFKKKYSAGRKQESPHAI